jgi:hypothetical protein
MHKRAPIPEFKGTERENVSDFLFLSETSFRVEKLAQADWVDNAAGYLRDAPLAVFKSLTASGTIRVTWEAFKERMCHEYQPFDKEIDLREQ